MNAVDVGIINIFEGGIHHRLRKIWAKIEALPKPYPWKVHWFENPDMLCHGDMLQRMWRVLRELPARYVLLTEHDFLPGNDFPGVSQFDLHMPETAVLAAEYCTRDPNSYKLKEHGHPGAWYILIDKDRLGRRELDFTAGGPFNDPAAKLPHDITAVIKSYDCMPHATTTTIRGRRLPDSHCGTSWDVSAASSQPTRKTNAREQAEELSQARSNAAGARAPRAPDGHLEAA
jgi:hypothetical protein